MSKKLTLFFIVLFFFRFHFALASDVIINEFVSDPSSGPEWVELLNNSSSPIDLSNWTWTELASPGGDTEHESSPKNLSGTISAGGVYVFEMNSALNNTGDSIGLFKGTNLEDRVTYGKVNSYAKNLDAPGKGKSGVYIDGNWLTNQNPTKGEQNPNTPPSSGGGSNDENDVSSSSSGNTVETKTKTVAIQKIKVQISGGSLACVGIPFSLEGRVFGTDGEQLFSGRYYWNFGDGDSREREVINVDKFDHAYYYPGDYAILLEHYPDFFTDVPDATGKLIIKVVTPEISISSVGDEKDFFVELANNTGYDVDLSGWFLLSGQKSFLIPKGTTLAAKSKVIFSSKVTYFSVEDKNSLKLMNPLGDLVFDYPASKVPKYSVSKTTTQNAVFQTGNTETIIPVDLSASAINSGVLKEGNAPSLPIIPVVSFVLIGASAGAVYFIRRKKVVPEAGNDFEILDE